MEIEESHYKNKVNIAVMVLFALGVMLIFFLSWKTNPNVGELSYIPDWLADWTDLDENSRIRTGVPFVGLGLLAGAYLIYIRKISFLYCFFAFLLLSMIVALAEAGQYFLPSRSPDLKDVIWGVLGAFIGLAFTYLMSKLINAVKTRF